MSGPHGEQVSGALVGIERHGYARRSASGSGVPWGGAASLRVLLEAVPRGSIGPSRGGSVQHRGVSTTGDDAMIEDRTATARHHTRDLRKSGRRHPSHGGFAPSSTRPAAEGSGVGRRRADQGLL